VSAPPISTLLTPLTTAQQRLVDVVAEAFVLDSEWPVFDYVEGMLEIDGLDAADTLHTFPRIGRWAYGAVTWIGQGQMPRPTVETEIELTVVGMHHSAQLRPRVQAFLQLIELMLDQRREVPLSRREPRRLAISDEDVRLLLRQERRLSEDIDSWVRAIPRMIAREPYLSSVSVAPDGSWTLPVPREAINYAGITTIDEYIERLAALTVGAAAPPILAAPSPLDLVAALDYLDAVWRVPHDTHLFTYTSAERVAKLTSGANTTEELDARLSALAEILRSARDSARTANSKRPNPGKLTATSPEHPLAPFEDYLVAIVDSAAEPRVRGAVTDLEHALALRDAAQHAQAGGRAVQALDAFDIRHPPIEPVAAWGRISQRVVEALGAVREELAAASP
jgi:hypothetical protein